MKARLLSLTALLAAVALWTATLGLRPLYEPDEGRYAEVAREMYVSGDWTTPRLNGVKFLDKPPLQYWATAGTFRLFGINEWAARIWSSVIGLFGIAMACWGAAVLFGRRAGVIAALVLAGSPLWILGSNLTTTDIGVGALLGSAVIAFAVAFQQRADILFPAVWALIGLAFLAKGLIAVALPAMTLALYVAMTRQHALFRSWRFWRWGLLALLIGAPWIVSVSLRNPEFLNYFFVHEHFSRFVSDVHSRNKPAWFFLAVGAVGMLPWAGLIPRAVSLRGKTPGKFDARLFLSLWVIVVLGFFSIAKSKLPLYILPAFPPLAILLAARITELRSRATAFAVMAMPLAGGALALLLWQPGLLEALSRHQVTEPRTLHWWGTIMAVLFILGGCAASEVARRGYIVRAVAAAALASLLAVQAGLTASLAFGALTVRTIGLKVKELRHDDTTLFDVGQLNRGLAFYAQTIPVVVVARDELHLGYTVEPNRWLASYDAFAQEWASSGHKLAVMRADLFERLRKRLGDTTVIVARSGANILVERQ